MQYLLTQEEYDKLRADRQHFDKEVNAKVEKRIVDYRNAVEKKMAALIERHLRPGGNDFFLRDLAATWRETR